jgi:hypothetical protein
MKNSIKIFAFLVFAFCLNSCYRDDPKPVANMVIFKAELKGSNEVPANSSAATGIALLTFNKTSKIFTVAVTHTVVAPTAGHIHKAAAGVNGGVVFPFATVISPFTYTSAALTPAQEADLMANLYYVNIHSAAFPGGEIRGQLIKK